jgi:DNA-binding Lrp family transcriptional regulator
MDDILKYLQDILGLSGTIKKLPESLLKKLPLYLRHGYNYGLLEISGNPFLLVEEGNISSKTVGQLKKQAKTIYQQTNLPVVFVLYSQSSQMRRNMIKNRLSFIVPENQIYLPDLLIFLKDNIRQTYSFSEQLTPSAQLLILYHLQVECLEEFSFKEIAEKLGYSPKTITKIAEELKIKKICQITGAKEKRFVFGIDRKQLWKIAEPQMQSPIIKSYFTSRKENEDFCKSGDMALAHYTFISNTGKEAYAVPKKVFEKLKTKDHWEYLDEVEGDVQIEVWKYNPRILSTDGYIDPLSLYLCYREDTNERVEAEIKELIDKRIW